jgi:anthranilate synthase component 1
MTMIPKLEAGEALVLVRGLSRCPDPIDLFRAVASGPGTMLLETAEASAAGAGKSLIVAGSALRLVCRGLQVEVDALNENGKALLPWLHSKLEAQCKAELSESALRCQFDPPLAGDEDSRLRSPQPISVLRELIFSLRDNYGEPSTAPLLVGSFAYDLLGCYEQLPEAKEDPLGWADYELWLPDKLIWLNHQRRSAQVVGYVFGGSANQSYTDVMHAVQTLVHAVESDLPAAATIDGSQSSDDAVSADMNDEQYAALVSKVQEHIVAGDVFQIVPSRTFSLPCSDALRAYRRLRVLNPSPYMFFIRGEKGTLLGASPETALKVDGMPRIVEITPIAGTRPRGRAPDGTLDLDLDSRLESALRLNEKEVAEHMMLVDLARNDVARVSVPGSRHVHRLLTVERYSHVMHLVSQVSGHLRRDLDALHAYVATMNMGTLVGAPKIKAAQLLRDYEGTKRGPYGGGVGYVTADGRMDTGIVIRTAVVRDGVAYVRAGAGVVYDSDPLAEADETRRKAQAVLTAIRQAEGGAK